MAARDLRSATSFGRGLAVLTAAGLAVRIAFLLLEPRAELAGDESTWTALAFTGLLRLRQFLMKDSYSFDLDEAGLDKSYQKHVEAYKRIFDRCGLKSLYVEAFSGLMGGSVSSEYTASSMPACRSPNRANRAGTVAIVQSPGSTSSISSQRTGVETVASGNPRTE